MIWLNDENKETLEKASKNTHNKDSRSLPLVSIRSLLTFLRRQHILHLLILIVIGVVCRLSSFFLGLTTCFVFVGVAQAIVICEAATLVQNGNFFEDLPKVRIRLLQLLSQGLHRPILVLTETIENKIQQLILGDTRGLENFSPFRLGGGCCVFLHTGLVSRLQGRRLWTSRQKKGEEMQAGVGK